MPGAVLLHVVLLGLLMLAARLSPPPAAEVDPVAVESLIVAGAITAGVAPNALKFLTALFVLAVLVIPDLVRSQWRARPAAVATHG